MAKTKRCPRCGELPEYTEVEDAPLPPAAQELRPPNPQIESALWMNAGLLQCGACRQYFAYRQWHPGGSCDALSTCTHESVSRLSPAETVVLLYTTIKETQDWMVKYPTPSLAEGYQRGIQGLEAELAALRARAAEVVESAARHVAEKHAGSDALLAGNGGKLPSWYPSDHLETLRRREEATAACFAAMRDEFSAWSESGKAARAPLRRARRGRRSR